MARDHDLVGIVAAVLVAFTGILLTPATVGAVCREGRASRPGAVEHCCWPGQHWSDESASCEGAAECPRGFERAGARCRAVLEEPYRAGPVPPGAHLVRRSGMTTVALGFTAFGTGYAFGFISAVSGTFANQCPLCAAYTASLIPVFGPIITAVGYSEGGGTYVSSFWTYEVMTALTQLVGAIGIMAGYRGQRVVVYDHAVVASPPRSPRFMLFPWAPGASGGLTLAAGW